MHKLTMSLMPKLLDHKIVTLKTDGLTMAIFKMPDWLTKYFKNLLGCVNMLMLQLVSTELPCPLIGKVKKKIKQP